MGGAKLISALYSISLVYFRHKAEVYIMFFQKDAWMVKQGLAIILKAGLRFVKMGFGEHFVAAFGKWCFSYLKHKETF